MAEPHPKGFQDDVSSTQAATERGQKRRCEYWQQVKDIAPHNLVFLDETGVMLGLTRTYARSPRGMRSL